MTRSLFLALPLSLLSLTPAHALSTDRQYDLRIEGTPVGTMTLRSRVTDDGKGSCQYTGRWSSLGLGLSRTRLCRFGERKASDYFDCEENRRTFFPTVISVDEGGCAGFDEWGQATDVPLLIAGESPRGDLNGVIMVQSLGDVQTFEGATQHLQVLRAPLTTEQPKLQVRRAAEQVPILVIP